jgi:hypothetical protein
MCQFFSLYFAATVSPQRVIHSDRTGWYSQGTAMRTPLPILKRDCRKPAALAGKRAKAVDFLDSFACKCLKGPVLCFDGSSSEPPCLQGKRRTSGGALRSRARFLLKLFPQVLFALSGYRTFLSGFVLDF